MPGQFTDKNGGNMAGHSDKWSDKNRRPNSYQAGQGSRGSRNQGTGAAGKANTVATDTVDTSKMSKEEKLKYFNSLGLLSPKQKQEMEPVQAPAPSANPVKELSDKLGKIFASKPQLIQGIVKALQAVPKEQLKDKAQAVLHSMDGNSSTEPTEVFSTIMQALEGPGEQQPETKPEPRNRTARMSEEEFRSTNEYLGDKFVQSMIDQANQFEESDKALFMIDMAIENVDDVNDVRAVRHSMASAADDLAAHGFELKSSSTEEPEEETDKQEVGSPEWVRMITNSAFEQNGTQPITSYNSYQDLIKNKKDHNLIMNYMDMTERSPKTKVLYDLAMQKLNDFDAEEGEESKFINIGDAFFSILKDGIDVEQSSGTVSTDEVQPKEVPEHLKHFVNTNKEALSEPTVEQGLDKFRNKDHQAELKEFLQWIADEMKKEGAKPASINKNINHYYNQLKDNYYKFRDARNAVTDNAEAYDPEYGSEIEHYLSSIESAIESFDRQGMSDDERNFVRIYNYMNDK